MKKSESTVKNVKVIRFQGPSRTGCVDSFVLRLEDKFFDLELYVNKDMMLATPWLLAVFLAVVALASPSPAINEIRQPSNKPGRFLSLPVPNKCAQREYHLITSTLLLVHGDSWQGCKPDSYRLKEQWCKTKSSFMVARMCQISKRYHITFSILRVRGYSRNMLDCHLCPTIVSEVKW
uniref:Uncharacterized protein n=1 Tax=Timema tahoe TaxID=61484 RepID=A0A7R9IQD4_9NEOP|nr:unnamed protein product [Timema tahoe]